MLFPLSIVLGVVAGYIFRGCLSNLPSLKLRRAWILFPALLLQLAIFPVLGPKPFFPYAMAVLHLVSYGLAGAWLLMNLRLWPMRLIGLGGALNLVVLVANRGYMPVSLDGLVWAGHAPTAQYLAQEGVYANVIPMTDTTHLNLLGDIFALPDWVPLAGVFSLGDVVIALGIAWLVAKGMMGNE